MALVAESGASARSTDLLHGSNIGLDNQSYLDQPSWGAHSASKMSRRKQQKPRQFPVDSEDPMASVDGLSGANEAVDTETKSPEVGGKCPSEDLAQLDDLLKHVQQQQEGGEEPGRASPVAAEMEQRDVKGVPDSQVPSEDTVVADDIDAENSVAKINDCKLNDLEEQPAQGLMAKDSEEYLDPDEDIDEDELNEMDYEMAREEGATPNEDGLTDPSGAFPDHNVKLKALENTRVAVAQIVENNFAPAEMIPTLLQTICNLQQQQMFQLQLLQMLQNQLLKTASEQAQKGPSEGGSSMNQAMLNANLAMLGNAVGMLPLPKIPSQGASSSATSTTTKDAAQTPIPAVVTPLPGTPAAPKPIEAKSCSSASPVPLLPLNTASTPGSQLSEPKFPFLDTKASSSSSPLPDNNGHGHGMDRSQYAADDPFFKHKCKFCHKILGSDSALQIHVRSHTGEKPYKCNVCGNRFSTKGNLKVHFERHKQQYPHLEMDDRMYPEDPSEREHSNPPSMVSSMGLPVLPTLPRAEPTPSPASSSDPIVIAPRPPAPPVGQPLPASPAVSAPTEPKEDKPHEKPEPKEMMKSPFPMMPGVINPFMPTSAPLPMSLPGQVPLPAFNSMSMGGLPGMPPHMPGFPGMEPPMMPRSSILPKEEEEEDPMEQFMEIDKSETSKLEALVKNIETKLTDPNQCAICKRILSCKSALQMHYRTHTGERPFKCKICGRAFTTKGNLKTHMGVHRSKPPLRMMHQCPVCHKQFTNGLVLQQHIRTHTGGDAPKMFPDMMPPMMGMMGMPFPPAGMPGMPPFPHPGMPLPPGMDLSALRYPQDPSEDSNLTGCESDENEDGNDLNDYSESPDKRERDEDDVEDRPNKQRRMDEDQFSSTEEPKEGSDEMKLQRPETYENYMPKSPSRGNTPSSYSTSLVALEERVKAIGEQGFKQFAPFQQMHAESFPTMTREDNDAESEAASDKSEHSAPAPTLETHDNKSDDMSNQQSPVSKGQSPPPLRPFGEEQAREMVNHMFQNGNSFHESFSVDKSNSQHSPVLPKTEMITPPKSDNSSPPKDGDFSSPDMRDGSSKSPAPRPMSSSSTPLPPIDPYQPRRNNNLRHMCNVCQKPFSSSSALQIHMRTHTGERPFKCEVCGKAFTTRGNLKVHMGTHMQQTSPARRGRRMSMEGIPGLTPPKEPMDFPFPPGFPGARGATELFPAGFPFPPPMNGFPFPKPNAIPVIQNPMFPHMLPPRSVSDNGENNNNTSPESIAAKMAMAGLAAQTELFNKDKLAFQMEKHRESNMEQGLNLSVK